MYGIFYTKNYYEYKKLKEMFKNRVGIITEPDNIISV